jgi:hypothetical protein
MWPCHVHKKGSLRSQKEELYGNSKYFTMPKYNLQKYALKKKPKSFKIFQLQ